MPPKVTHQTPAPKVGSAAPKPKGNPIGAASPAPAPSTGWAPKSGGAVNLNASGFGAAKPKPMSLGAPLPLPTLTPAPLAQAPVAAPQTAPTAATQQPGAVPTSLPIDQLSQVGRTPGGAAFQLDGGSVEGMEVRVKQIVHPTHGPGTELAMKLTAEASLQLSLGFGGNHLPGATSAPYVVERAKFENGATVMEAEGYVPVVSGKYGGSEPLQAHRLEEAGKYSVEYVPPRGNPQAYRSKLRVRVFGATDAERKENLQSALARLTMPELVADADPARSEILRRTSVLRMVAPAQEEAILHGTEPVTLQGVDQALAESAVAPERMGGVRVSEVFPGHIAAVDPVLGKAYDELGVRALMVGVRKTDHVVLILTSDGLMSSAERYGRGIQSAGASLSSDERSGGAEYAFTRLVTQKAIEGGSSISSAFASGEVQLLSTGEEMKQLLSRTDWHAYASDNYGVAVPKYQTEGPHADEVSKSVYNQYQEKFTERRVLGELVARVNGEQEAPGSYGSGYRASNEVMFRSGVPAQAFNYAIVASESLRAEMIEKLKAAGVSTLGGKPVEQAVLVATDWKQVGQQLGIVPQQ